MAKYMVSPGKSIMTRVGIIDEFQEIDIKKIGSVSVFNALIKCGSICEMSDKPKFSKSQLIELRNRPRKIVHQNIIEKPVRAEVKDIEIIEPKAEIKRKTVVEDKPQAEGVKPADEKPADDTKPKRKYTRKKVETEAKPE